MWFGGIVVVNATQALGDDAFSTPEGKRIDVRGACLLINARQGTNAHVFDEAWCDRYQTTQVGPRQLYEWAPDFLLEAFDNAERVRCKGELGCVTGARPVRMAIVADGFADARIAGD